MHFSVHFCGATKGAKKWTNSAHGHVSINFDNTQIRDKFQCWLIPRKTERNWETRPESREAFSHSLSWVIMRACFFNAYASFHAKRSNLLQRRWNSLKVKNVVGKRFFEKIISTENSSFFYSDFPPQLIIITRSKNRLDILRKYRDS